ncbi:MAG TPA: phosphodiester glycosidase family protein [Ktedonobacteraceae bacterium]|nr:phosphodiester glycosidase family protein [Ktedonobacteraceae bacterium]
MRLKQSFWHNCLLPCLLLLPFLAGCDMLPGVSVTIGTSSPTAASPGWNTIAPGVDVRTETWKSPSTTNVSDVVSIVRFNLHNVAISVAYQPDQPLSMQEWMQKEQAIALMNGGYFDGQDQATGLVVSDGQVFGTSYQGFGGMLDVTSQGKVQLRSLRDHPYDSSEGISQATQCTPMLLLGGKRTEFNADKKASPRSVVALDKQGRLLFIASPGVAFTLDDLATLLEKSDLNLVTALNLDGGSSTGLYVDNHNANSQTITIDSYVNLPLVIVVKAK